MGYEVDLPQTAAVKAVAQMVQQLGNEVLHNAPAARNGLADVLPHAPRVRDLLGTAVTAGVARDAATWLRADELTGLRFRVLVVRLTDEHAISEGPAEWATVTWCVGLGRAFGMQSAVKRAVQDGRSASESSVAEGDSVSRKPHRGTAPRSSTGIKPEATAALLRMKCVTLSSSLRVFAVFASLVVLVVTVITVVIERFVYDGAASSVSESLAWLSFGFGLNGLGLWAVISSVALALLAASAWLVVVLSIFNLALRLTGGLQIRFQQKE